jgi:hypothetical protein
MPDVIGIDNDLLAGAHGVKHALEVTHGNSLPRWATSGGDKYATVGDVEDHVLGRIQDGSERLVSQAQGEDGGVDHRENLARVPDVQMSRSGPPVPNDEEIPERLMGRYPPADISPDEFEQFVADVLSAGAPGLEGYRVTPHEVLEGTDGTYDFDATVRFSYLGADFLVVVEAKRHANAIKRELVQVLHSKMGSVGAQKAILVSTAAFQRGAINFAKTHGIALVRVSEGRFTYETRNAELTGPPSGDEAREHGIPTYIGACFGPGERPSSISITLIDPKMPDLIQRALLDVSPALPKRGV